ncbi:hypothetical protein XELAEV_18018388mg [Xenopus laevis]|uniref:Uncharacterized protein n=1 Tax=Xenopus laevis TaxID=8355 RepID=A0A974DEZ1_XENLA|nr:hypothetical protein XELAEV_18018388mg [Xenopus laevis]
MCLTSKFVSSSPLRLDPSSAINAVTRVKCSASLQRFVTASLSLSCLCHPCSATFLPSSACLLSAPPAPDAQQPVYVQQNAP